MKLQNKETGDIGYLYANKDRKYHVLDEDTNKVLATYETLEGVTEEWEDYEEPKEWWYISEYGTVEKTPSNTRETIYDKARKHFGNYFETKEEAERAVEKLKAWERLRERGFKFTGWHRDKWYCGDFTIEATGQLSCDDKDLDLLFGGKE